MSDPEYTGAGQGRDFRIGAVFSASFAIFRDHPQHFLGLGAVLSLPPVLLILLFGDASDIVLLTDTETETDSTAVDIARTLQSLLFLVLVAAGSISTYDAQRGRRPDIGASLSGVARRALHLLLLMLIYFVVAAVLIAILALGALSASEIGGVAPTVLIVALVLVIMIWLMIRYLVSVPATVIEGVGGIDALGRSAALTRGHWWKIFGINLLLFVAVVVAMLIVSAILIGIISAVPATATAGLLSFIVVFPLQIALSVIWAIILCVTYYQLRHAKEGVGVEDIAAVFD